VAALCHILPAPPVVVGASLGGLAALIAVGESEVPLARALVLVDIAPRIETAGAQRILEFMLRRPGLPDLDTAAQAVADYLPHRRHESVIAPSPPDTPSA
jgi:pimeloyl-ACP methyl ester carboxylesterase